MKLPSPHLIVEYIRFLIPHFPIVILKFPYLLPQSARVSVEPNESLHIQHTVHVRCTHCCFSKPLSKMSLKHYLQTQRWFSLLLWVEFKIFITYTQYFRPSEGKAWKLHIGF